MQLKLHYFATFLSIMAEDLIFLKVGRITYRSKISKNIKTYWGLPPYQI